MSAELESIDKQIAELQQKKEAILNEQRQAKLDEIKSLVKLFGFTPSDLGFSPTSIKNALGTNKPTPAKTYINPQDKSLVWHGGRGVKPNWVKEFLANGGKLEDIEVK